MRHGYYGRNLSRPVGKRMELFKSLLNEVFRRGKIETSITKAKAVRGDIDKLINTAKKQTAAARIDLEKTLTAEIAKKLFRDVKEKVFDDRTSGYSRIVRLGTRFSDTTEMCSLELIKQVIPKNE
ncbi:MAG: 50S ribosomal protein L17 [bacterium]|nr:50S ribosomal protein L17 [bacterium]